MEVYLQGKKIKVILWPSYLCWLLCKDGFCHFELLMKQWGLSTRIDVSYSCILLPKKKKKTKKKWNRGKLQNTWPLVVLIFNNWSILYFSDSPFKLLQKRLKASGQGFCSCFVKCCCQIVSEVMVQCLYSCDVLRTNWKYKWPNIDFDLRLVLTSA